MTPEASRRDGPGRYPPPSPVQALRALLVNPEAVKTIHQACRAVYEPYPEGGAGLFVWSVLTASGIIVPYGYGLQRQCYNLARAGFRGIPAARNCPLPGDVFVVVNGSGFPLHMGFVAKTATDKSWFLALDNNVATEGARAFRPYRREAEGTAAGFYLRLGGGRG